MRCSNTTCGAEGTGKFCQECGYGMAENPQTRTVVICTGEREDRSPCLSELVPGQSFCMYCGTKVDQTLFNIDQEHCRSCKSLLFPGKPFCADCGQKVSQPCEYKCLLISTAHVWNADFVNCSALQYKMLLVDNWSEMAKSVPSNLTKYLILIFCSWIYPANIMKPNLF